MAAAKRTKRTRSKPAQRSAADWAPTFLVAVAQLGIILDACKVAGIGRTAVYERRNSDPDFAAALAAALEDACDDLEGEARRRAFIGLVRKKFNGKGVPIIDPETKQQYVEREYSDQLLTLLLKAHRPERFRDNVKVEHAGKVNVSLKAEELSDDELAAIVDSGRKAE